MPNRDGTVCIFSSRRAIDDPDGEAREDKARGAGRGRAHDNIDLSYRHYPRTQAGLRVHNALCTAHETQGGGMQKGPRALHGRQ